MPGIDSPLVFRIWTVPDMGRIVSFIDEKAPKTAVIAGGGFIGMEMAEAFVQRGISTTMVELHPHVMSTMDPEFGSMIERRLAAHGVTVRTGVGLSKVDAGCASVELSDGSSVPAAIVLVAAGVKAELSLARAAGLDLGAVGGLVVDEYLSTSDPFIWAAGDMNEVVHKVSDRTVRVPMAGPANRQGRIAASNAMGMSMKYSGALGSSVVKIFDAAVAGTGLTETAARAAGFDAGSTIVVKDHHASYYPGGKELVLKLVYDRATGRLLGGQALGEEGVEKRIDALAVALHGKMTLSDLAEIDFAYSPPFSSANDPLNVAAFAGLNDLSGYAPLVGAQEARRLLAEAPAGEAAAPRPVLLDVRNLNEYETAHVRGALHIPLDELRFRLDEVPRDASILVHCRSGFRSHLALRILMENGWKNVRNITGGFVAMTAAGGFPIDE